MCRPEKECHCVDRNEIIFWYSKRYFVPSVTKIRFQIKPHIFFLFFYDGIQRNFNSKSAVSRFLGVSEIENYRWISLKPRVFDWEGGQVDFIETRGIQLRRRLGGIHWNLIFFKKQPKNSCFDDKKCHKKSETECKKVN